MEYSRIIRAIPIIGGLAMHNQKDDKPTYVDLFIIFSTRFEKWLKRIIVVLLIVLLLSQLLLQSAEFRYYFTTIGKVEG